MTDLLFDKGILKVSAERIRKWISEEKTDYILFALSRGNYRERITCLKELKSINNPQTLPFILYAIDDPVEMVSKEAIETLIRIDSENKYTDKINSKLNFWNNQKQKYIRLYYRLNDYSWKFDKKNLFNLKQIRQILNN